jgi:hypothetical protein
MAASFKIEIAVPVAVRHLHADSCSQQNGRSGDFFESISAIFLDNKRLVGEVSTFEPHSKGRGLFVEVAFAQFTNQENLARMALQDKFRG